MRLIRQSRPSVSEIAKLFDLLKQDNLHRFLEAPAGPIDGLKCTE